MIRKIIGVNDMDVKRIKKLVKKLEEEENDRFCVKCGKTSDLIDSEDMCYTCAKERGRI